MAISHPEAHHSVGKPSLVLPALLEKHRESIEEMLDPCMDLEFAGKLAGKEDPARPESSKLFGTPFLPHAGDWPRTPEGRPMFFVGQLNMEELMGAYPSPEKPLPPGGVLSFFYDIDAMPPGLALEDRYRFRLVWTPRGVRGGPVDPLPGAPPLTLAEKHLRGRPAWRLPSEVDGRFRLGALDEAEFKAYSALPEVSRGLGGHRLLGPPDWMEEDARATCAELTAGFFSSTHALRAEDADSIRERALEWRLLWQIGGEEDLDLARGEEARIYILIREQDLAQRRFDRAWSVVQCG